MMRRHPLIYRMGVFMERKELRRSLDELNRITGLSLDINPLSQEDSSYTLTQLNALISAYKEKNNKVTIFKKWVSGEIDAQELQQTAKRFHIPLSSYRALFLIETKEDMDDSALTILRYAFPNTINILFVSMSPRQLIMIDTFSKDPAEKKLLEIAYLIMDILNTEALIQVKISFSAIIEHLNQLPRAYQEANLALNVGKIFYSDQNVYPHNKLGLGRLIYGLSKEQCIAYMKETFGDKYPSVFQPETIHVINCFLNNNLNIAETARQLHMHRNTLIYRLEQIEKETGLDTRQFHDAMTIKTAIFVMNYLKNL